MIVKTEFFADEAHILAPRLLGKVLRRKFGRFWLAAQIIETEAYGYHDRASHSFLGHSKKNHAMYMKPGTIYMYYSRGGDSLNISCQGDGGAVLIKSAIPYLAEDIDKKTILSIMQNLNYLKGKKRKLERLCSGQALLCKSLNLKVWRWNEQQFDPHMFYIDDIGYLPTKIIYAPRLNIPEGRDEDRLYRFIDSCYVKYCTKNPLTSTNLG